MIRYKKNKDWGMVSFHVFNEQEIEEKIHQVLRKISFDKNDEAKNELKDGEYISIDLIDIQIRTSVFNDLGVTNIRHDVTLFYAVIPVLEN